VMLGMGGDGGIPDVSARARQKTPGPAEIGFDATDALATASGEESLTFCRARSRNIRCPPFRPIPNITPSKATAQRERRP
jgi:hypothetical protein